MNDFLELTKGLVESKDFEEKSDFEPVPKGTYRISVANVEKRNSKNSGNDYIGMALEIVDGELTERKIFDNFHFTAKTAENTIKRIYKMAQMVDIPAETFSTIDDIVEFCSKFVGKAFEVEYDEEAFHRVSYTKAL